MTIVAIQADDYDPPSSPIWADVLQKHGIEVRWVDVRRTDILEQISGCQGFMWRWGQFGGMGRIARRLLPVMERELGMEVYPDQDSCWHYDDKIAQSYLFQALGIPTPKTFIWFDRWKALEWADEAPVPLVMKFTGGAGSQNVRLIRDKTELKDWINRMFTFRLSGLEDWEKVRLIHLPGSRRWQGFSNGG